MPRPVLMKRCSLTIRLAVEDHMNIILWMAKISWVTKFCGFPGGTIHEF